MLTPRGSTATAQRPVLAQETPNYMARQRRQYWERRNTIIQPNSAGLYEMA